LEQHYSGQSGRFTLYQIKGQEIDPHMLNHWAHGLKTRSWMRNGETLVIVGNIDDAVLGQMASALGAPTSSGPP
jgi:hypothetical protein